MTIKVSLINQRSTILFEPLRTWEEEDIAGMVTFFYSHCKQCLQRESILGADRVSERFEWKNEEYLLQFETYSQSVWIEAHYEKEPNVSTDLTALYLYLSETI